VYYPSLATLKSSFQSEGASLGAGCETTNTIQNNQTTISAPYQVQMGPLDSSTTVWYYMGDVRA